MSLGGFKPITTGALAGRIAYGMRGLRIFGVAGHDVAANLQAGHVPIERSLRVQQQGPGSESEFGVAREQRDLALIEGERLFGC